MYFATSIDNCSHNAYACFISFIISLERRQDIGFELWIKIEHTDFTDWMSFLTSNIIEEINVVQVLLEQIPKQIC